MKKFILSILIAIASCMVLESLVPLKRARKDGTDPGYTGSPGDGYKNCTFCHGGTIVNVPGWITSDIPSTGYVPGQTYTITATNTEVGATRFGFEVSPQALNGDMKGTLVISDTARTQLVGSGKYITYKEAGVDGLNSLSWTFKWIAPPTGSGNVVFYGAFNSNFDGNKDEDHTYLSTLATHETGTNAVRNEAGQAVNFAAYPNPAGESLRISFNLPAAAHVLTDIADMEGRQVAVIMDEKRNGTVHQEISTSRVPAGNYLLRLSVNGQTTIQKVSIAH